MAKLRLRRFNLRPVLGLGQEVDPDHLRWHGIPQRDPEAKPNLIDLTCYYNAGLHEEWDSDLPGSSLSALPKGVRELAGTRFDIRGIVQLSFRDQPNGWRYPRQIVGMKIGAKAKRLHFLQAISEFGSPPGGYGNSVATYVIHYHDGRTYERALQFGDDVRNWWEIDNEPVTGPSRAVIAWSGPNPAGHKAGIRLFKWTWENPHPDAEIESLDCVATSSTGSPFIVAITAD